MLDESPVHVTLKPLTSAGAGPLCHHRGQHELHGDVVSDQRTRLHAAQQRGHPVPPEPAERAEPGGRGAAGCMTPKIHHVLEAFFKLIYLLPFSLPSK